MDFTSTQLSEEEKTAIYNQLAELLIVGLEKADIEEASASESAKYILEQLKLLATKAELLGFLEKLAAQWDIYKEAYAQAKKQEIMQKIEQGMGALAAFKQ